MVLCYFSFFQKDYIIFGEVTFFTELERFHPAWDELRHKGLPCLLRGTSEVEHTQIYFFSIRRDSIFKSTCHYLFSPQVITICFSSRKWIWLKTFSWPLSSLGTKTQTSQKWSHEFKVTRSLDDFKGNNSLKKFRF